MSSPRKPRNYWKLAIAGLLLLAAVPVALEYTCPMHPEIRKEQPGRCPECGMKLVPVEESE